jgi:TRAP-type uncharacterized transport system substrate-binding protein
MHLANKILRPSVPWRGKALARVSLLLVTAALIAALAAAFGIARDYGYLRATILTGSPGGQYHALATRLADRATREHGILTVIPTAGSIENVRRLASPPGRCEMFALIQDGTPVPTDARLELLGRLPAPESLLLLGRTGNTYRALPDLRGASIGIGPEGSGTAYLMQQLFADTDLRGLDVHLSKYELAEQARLVAEGKLDLAAFVMQEDAEFLNTVIHQYSLDIVAPQDLQGLIARYPWLSLGQIPAGRYDLVRPLPAIDKQVVRLRTLLIASPCAQRADRIALLMLAAAELPNFVRDNPPSSTAPASGVAARARGASVLSDRRARACRSILPMAGQSHVAGLLGLPVHGRDGPFQHVEGVQPISPLADRCGARKARDRTQGAGRSGAHARSDARSSGRTGDGLAGATRCGAGDHDAAAGPARPLSAPDKFRRHPHGR